MRIVTPGIIDGEIGGHCEKPFRFAKWFDPHRFVVTDGRAFYEIEWVGPGRLELLSVRREL
ncbi:MAG: hypothetical protein IPG61_07755 [bacterium]|nr:hypothetical protein [bacterium]